MESKNMSEATVNRKNQKKNKKNEKTYVSDRMLGPQTSPCQTRFFRFFRLTEKTEKKPKKPKKPMSQIECWVPRHLPVRLGFFGFFGFLFCFFCCFEFVSFFLLGAFWWIDLMQSDGRVGK